MSGVEDLMLNARNGAHDRILASSYYASDLQPYGLSTSSQPAQNCSFFVRLG
jgi:hypothetical protein